MNQDQIFPYALYTLCRGEVNDSRGLPHYCTSTLDKPLTEPGAHRFHKTSGSTSSRVLLPLLPQQTQVGARYPNSDSHVCVASTLPTEQPFQAMAVFLSFLSMWYWELNPGPCAHQASTLPESQIPSLILKATATEGIILEDGQEKYLEISLKAQPK